MPGSIHIVPFLGNPVNHHLKGQYGFRLLYLQKDFRQPGNFLQNTVCLPGIFLRFPLITLPKILHLLLRQHGPSGYLFSVRAAVVLCLLSLPVAFSLVLRGPAPFALSPTAHSRPCIQPAPKGETARQIFFLLKQQCFSNTLFAMLIPLCG